MAAVIRTIFNSSSNKSSFWLRVAAGSYRTSIVKHRLYSSQKKNDEEIDFDRPIRYSTSPAATWKAESSFSGTPHLDVTPWYQPYVVCLSVGIFLIYFCILREESDIDKEFEVPLFDRVEGLEEVQLLNVIQYYKTNDPQYDTAPLEKRLAEVQASKKLRN